jgi:sialate O-acetylesterase
MKIRILALLLLMSISGFSNVKLPKVLSDNMVPQRNKPINVWGWADILVGEGWVCSSQSNMEWPLRPDNNAEQEIKQANYRMIRHFGVQKSVASKLEDDVKEANGKFV